MGGAHVEKDHISHAGLRGDRGHRDLRGAGKKFERVSIMRDICDACAKSCEISDDTEIRACAECKNAEMCRSHCT